MWQNLRRTGIGVLFIVVSIPSFAQSQLIDSLKVIIKTSTSPIPKTAALIRLSKEYAESSPDSALVYSNQALLLAEGISSDSLKAHVLISFSTAYSLKANYEESTKLALQAIDLAKDTITILDAFNNIGIDYLYNEDYENSFTYFTKLEQLAISAKDSLRLGHALNNLGLIHYYLENGNKELEAYLRAKTIFTLIGEQEGLGNTLLNIGTVYTETSQFKKALAYYMDALAIFKKIGYANAYGNVLQSLAEHYLEEGKTNKALTTANEALGIFVKNDFKQDIVYSYELITSIYVAMGDYKNAYDYQEKYNELNSQLFNEEKAKQLNKLHISYESEKQKQQIELLEANSLVADLELLKRERNMMALVLFIIVLISVAIYVVITNRKKHKLVQQLLFSEANELRLQIKSLIEGDLSLIEIDQEKLNNGLVTKLSEREVEVLNLAITDMTNSEIANKIFVSVNTVKYHLKNVYEKLGVTNRKEALQFALKSSQ